ncbi:MAG: PfkB family carbohydrate kinase, partial [Treponema sp.]|nr:PfkB family carbohydrate kinase [Treponema sp.]
LLDLLESYGVNTSGVIRYGGATGQAIIQLDKNRQNAIVLYPGGNGAVTRDEAEAVLGGFGGRDMIVLQNEISCLREIMELAWKRGMRICFNPSPCNEKIEGLPLELAGIFFVNEIEGATLAGISAESPPQEVMDRLTGRFPGAEIILTTGKDGACYGCGAYRARAGGLNVPVVDTIGAGDTFTGYFLAARERKMPVPQALAAACKASSITVSRPGAMESIPLANEVF